MPEATPTMPSDERALAQLTPLELEMLHLMADGLGTMEMAQRLGIATDRVAFHVSHVMEKLQAHSELQGLVEL